MGTSWTVTITYHAKTYKDVYRYHQKRTIVVPGSDALSAACRAGMVLFQKPDGIEDHVVGSSEIYYPTEILSCEVSKVE